MMILQLFVYGSVVRIYPFLLPLQKIDQSSFLPQFQQQTTKKYNVPSVQQSRTNQIANQAKKHTPSVQQSQTNQIRNKAEKHWAKNNTTVEFYTTYLLPRGKPTLPRCFFPKKVLNKYWICQKT